jgi:hypothetical protein
MMDLVYQYNLRPGYVGQVDVIVSLYEVWLKRILDILIIVFLIFLIQHFIIWHGEL